MMTEQLPGRPLSAFTPTAPHPRGIAFLLCRVDRLLGLPVARATAELARVSSVDEGDLEAFAAPLAFLLLSDASPVRIGFATIASGATTERAKSALRHPCQGSPHLSAAIGAAHNQWIAALGRLPPPRLHRSPIMDALTFFRTPILSAEIATMREGRAAARADTINWRLTATQSTHHAAAGASSSKWRWSFDSSSGSARSIGTTLALGLALGLVAALTAACPSSVLA